MNKQIKEYTYSSWKMMRYRGRQTEGYYKDISVCAEWQDFERFLSDMGPRPKGHSIDRIDNTLGYYPGNCRWATQSQQRRNQRYYDTERSKWLSIAQENGIKGNTFQSRLREGWSLEDAATIIPKS